MPLKTLLNKKFIEKMSKKKRETADENKANDGFVNKNVITSIMIKLGKI
jgi:hypothetical protein